MTHDPVAIIGGLFAPDAGQVRWRDDDAKDPDAAAPPFARYEGLLRRLAR